MDGLKTLMLIGHGTVGVPKIEPEQPRITRHYPDNSAQCKVLEDGSLLCDGSKLVVDCTRCTGYTDLSKCYILNGSCLRRKD